MISRLNWVNVLKTTEIKLACSNDSLIVGCGMINDNLRRAVQTERITPIRIYRRYGISICKMSCDMHTAYANSKGSDQPANAHSLIGIFAFRIYEVKTFMNLQTQNEGFS